MKKIAVGVALLLVGGIGWYALRPDPPPPPPPAGDAPFQTEQEKIEMMQSIGYIDLQQK